MVFLLKRIKTFVVSLPICFLVFPVFIKMFSHDRTKVLEGLSSNKPGYVQCLRVVYTSALAYGDVGNLGNPLEVHVLIKTVKGERYVPPRFSSGSPNFSYCSMIQLNALIIIRF